MKWGVDSAYPAADPLRLAQLGFSFACGYIGGRALNVWTPEQWRDHAAAGLQLGPIWVAPGGAPPVQAGVDDGNAALAAMQALGMSGMVLLDVENGAEPIAYGEGFLAACHAGQATVGVYGSRSTLLAMGGVDAWWLAEWVQSGVRVGLAPPDWSMWQYATGPQFDYNVARDDFPFVTLA